jgi:glutaminyl-peptide cyclotransferase
VKLLVIVLVVQAVLGLTLIALVATDNLPFTDGEADGASEAPTPAVAVDRFDDAAAWQLLVEQVELGPRPAGSEASRRLAARLRDLVPNGRYQPVPGGLQNVVGTVRGREPGYIVVGAHYDTKDIPGFVGANDGAGGVATVLELSRALRQGRRACEREIRFVMFDGEESPAGSPDAAFLRDGLRGSKAYAAAHARELAAVVVVDFVADRDLAIQRESGSSAALWRLLRASARRAGTIDAFPPGTGGLILDDHTPFAERGVPSIDLIDFDYPWWHTPEDDLDKVSARSLDQAGEALVEMLRRLGRQTCRS